MDERLKFVARLLEGEKMAKVCREFGISRKTGYKIYDRYKEHGLEGLKNRSRRPHRHANQIPFQVEREILRIKKEYKNFGAPKIRENLLRRFPDIPPPATSTIHAILDRHGLVKRRKRRRYKAKGTELQSTKESFAFTVFEQAFKELGMPNAIRTDNGIPFSCCNALHGLSRLSVWWLRLGIAIERIKPGHPQQNGRHERMHLTLKKEATKPPGFNFLQQQNQFDRFIEHYNNERPHQALNMKYPGELYTPSARAYQVPDDPEYPMHDLTIRVTRCGRICLNRLKINFSTVFAGQMVGITETADKIWLVSFMDYDLGYFDEEARRVEPIDNPFKAKVLPMSSE